MSCLAVMGCGEKKSKEADVKSETEIIAPENGASELVKLTSGPKQHWFGYYDKLQIDPTGRYVLAMEVDTIHRSPKKEDKLVIGMIDLEDNNKWITLG